MNIKKFAKSIRDIYGIPGSLSLHEPKFTNRDKELLCDAIDTTFVSSIGGYINKFEQELSNIIEGSTAVAVVNGTSALHICLLLAGVKTNDLVLTQSLSFVATSNAISYCNADPIFIDVDRSTLGMSPDSLHEYLQEHATMVDGQVIDLPSGRNISAVVPMHTFGHPVRLKEISDICAHWGLTLIEDAAEGLGSRFNGFPIGSFGKFAAISFNGNKIITTGGGGAVLCKDPDNAAQAKHLTATAKLPHRYEFIHDMVGYNYRMPNLNAALGVAQLERLGHYVSEKREIAQIYNGFCVEQGVQFFNEPFGAESNFWLNSIICESDKDRQSIILGLEANDIHVRPVWRPLHLLPMYAGCSSGDLSVTNWLADRILNLPSSPRSTEFFNA